MCDCIKQATKELKDSNTKLVIPMTMNFSTNKTRADRVSVETAKIDSKIRKRKLTILAAYCPFCGEKY